MAIDKKWGVTARNALAKHSLRVGWRNFFSSCAVVSVFGSGGKSVLVYILMYLEYHTVVVLCQFFCFWREIVFGTYVLIMLSQMVLLFTISNDCMAPY